VTRQWTTWPRSRGLDTWQGQEIFGLCKTSRSTGAQPASYPVVTGDSFPRGKAARAWNSQLILNSAAAEMSGAVPLLTVLHTVYTDNLPVVHKLSKNQPHQNSRPHVIDVKQVSYWEVTNTRGHHIKYCLPGDVAARICVHPCLRMVPCPASVGNYMLAHIRTE
jgi:hypothetical protein